MTDISLEDIDFDSLSVSESEIKNWIDEHADVVDDARELWLDLDVNVLSAVENPAHPSEVVAIKEDGAKVTEVPALKSDEEQIIKAPAMVADRPDREGDVTPAPVVKEAAHRFLKEKRNDQIDSDHETPIGSEESLTNRGTVVESYLLEEDKEFDTVNGEKIEYKEGDWMVNIEVTDDETWERFKNGELTGLSIMGRPKAVQLSNDLIQSEDNNQDMSDDQIEDLKEEIQNLKSEVQEIRSYHDEDEMDGEEDEDEMDEKADIDDLRGDLEQYNIDTEEMTDDDVLEFAQGLHGDLMDTLENMDDEDEMEEDEMDGEEDEDEMDEEEQAEEENLEDPEFESGDAVMWSSNDTPVHGRVNDIHEQYSPAEGVTITGDEGEAVYSIYEYDDSLENPVFRDSPSDPNIAKPESSLSESNKDMPDASDENFDAEESIHGDEGEDEDEMDEEERSERMQKNAEKRLEEIVSDIEEQEEQQKSEDTPREEDEEEQEEDMFENLVEREISVAPADTEEDEDEDDDLFSGLI